jgi:Tfp pilus assembly protein FimT
MERSYIRGISLVELIIAIAIAGFLVGIAVTAFANLSNTDLVESSTQEVLSTLREAQSQAVESLADSAYGVHFTGSSAILFAGAIYQSGAAGNMTLELPSSVTASATPSNFVFQKISGTTTSGTIQLFVSSHASYEKTISVSPTGAAEIQ